VKLGIKGGLAAVIAIVSLKWMHPAGATSVPLWAWLLTVLGRPFPRAGGTGDLPAFRNATIIDSFLGMMFGMLIATVVSRLLWPILPQQVLRDADGPRRFDRNGRRDPLEAPLRVCSI
jgi:hypothetical protein